jgi:hypothetical protein
MKIQKPPKLEKFVLELTTVSEEERQVPEAPKNSRNNSPILKQNK